MPDADQTKSIRVHILGREYALRVKEEDEGFTRRVASAVNARMEEFKDNHPEQAELTTAVITALALAEDLYELQEEREQEQQGLNEELSGLADRLDAVLGADGDDA